MRRGRLIRKLNDGLNCFTGGARVKEVGYNTFFFQDTKGSKLLVSNTLVMQFNDSKHTSSFYMMPLSKGFYTLRIEYAEKKKTINYRLLHV